MNGVGHPVADPGHGAKGIGAGPQVGNLPQKLQGVAFLLEGVLLRVGRPQQLHRLGVDLVPLAPALGLDQFPGYADAAPGIEGFHQGIMGRGLLHHNLEVFQG